jgi:hypothetical protein
MNYMASSGRPLFCFAFDSSLVFELKDYGIHGHNFTELLSGGKFGLKQKEVLRALGSFDSLNA